MSLALFSYALALHSRKDTGVVHFFFAAFAAFCRNLLVLIDLGTRSPFHGHQYRLFLDLALLLALALAVMGSFSFLSAQGIRVGARQKRYMIATAAAFWLIPAFSGLVGMFKALGVLHHAAYNSSVVCLAWLYYVLGLVAARHFKDAFPSARKLSIAALIPLLLHPFLRMYCFSDFLVPKSSAWWWADAALLGSSTILIGVVVAFVARGARNVDLKSLLRKELRADKVLSKRVVILIGLTVLAAVLLSVLLIQRSGVQLTTTVAKELQYDQMSELLSGGARLKKACETLRSCLGGLSQVAKSTGGLALGKGVASTLVTVAQNQLPCSIVVSDKEGNVISSYPADEHLYPRLKAFGALPLGGEASASQPEVAGPVFVGRADSQQGVVAFHTSVVIDDAGYGDPFHLYALAPSDSLVSRFFKIPDTSSGNAMLLDENGAVILSKSSAVGSGSIGSYLSLTEEEEKALLSKLRSGSPGNLVLRTGRLPTLLSHCPANLGRHKFYCVAVTPWDTVLASIDSAYLKQYQLLGFIMFLVLFGSGTAIAVSTNWGRALERVMERKTEQLRHEKINLEQALRSIGNPLIVVNEEFEITYKNPEFVSAFGSVNGERCYSLMFGRNEPCTDCLATEAMKTDQVCHGVRLSEGDPETRCFDITASPKKDLEGNVLGSIILLNDITKRNALERKVKESEEKYKRLIEASPDMVCIVQAGKLVYANRVFVDKLGYSPRELFSGDFDPVSGIVHVDSRADAQEGLRQAETAEVAEEVELSLVTRDGQELRVLFKGVQITYSGQKAVEVILVDITKLKELHRQLLQAEKLASLGELTASIAHELNNKLAPILAYSQMLRKKVADEEVTERLWFIEKCAIGAKSVLETLLAYPRASSSVRQYVDVNKILEETIQLIKYRLDACNIDLMTELDPELPKTMADPKQIEQVFLNIMNNAYQAMEDRGGTLYVLSYVDGSNLEFQITDTGPGIPEANLDRIFEPFFTTKPDGKGTGLGLPCSYGIAKAHNGDLRCKSKLNRGTTFTLVLPIVEGEAECAAEPEDIAATASPASSANILVVDDESMLRGMVSEILSPDHNVLQASDGREAIAMLEHEDIDLLIVDLRMPGLDGFALHGWVKDNKPDLMRSILFTTGDIYEPKTREFVKQSDVRCISKPFSVEMFLKQVNSLLSERAAASV